MENISQLPSWRDRESSGSISCLDVSTLLSLPTSLQRH